ncbi:MAG: hypothetical protein ABSB76_25075 [Streptosporangiaceae bacterium]|jgi:hypothetical protein
MADDPVRIAQFWQAVEIFSPQSLPRLDPENHTVDLQRLHGKLITAFEGQLPRTQPAAPASPDAEPPARARHGQQRRQQPGDTGTPG